MEMASSPHIILFPLMSKGHTIPFLHLTKLLHNHRPQATFTIFTTPANEPFISHSLSSLPPNLLNIISLPFNSPLIPPGVESTDKLPSMSLFFTFITATEQLQGGFESALEELLCRDDHVNIMRATFLVSDGFLYWTQESASKFNLPRLVYYGMSAYSQVIFRLVMSQKDSTTSGPDEFIHVPEFPSVRVTRKDFENPLNNPDEGCDPQQELILKCAIATSKSYGELINSFHELEPRFLEYKSSKYKPRSCSVGPFCLADHHQPRFCSKSGYIDWLDTKKIQKTPVLYVAFGSQAEISTDQLKEIAVGLEMSGAHFLWALRIKPNQEAMIEGFEERVKERGLIVKEWVEQREVLHHESVEGFLSHCGWNSVTESISAGVPILAWPLSAEQPLNARMVEDEIKVGLRVETSCCDGFVKREEISKLVKKLMGGEEGKVVRERAKELSEAAKKAVQEGGSSWKNLESLLNELEANNRSTIQQEVGSKDGNGMSNDPENENGSSSGVTLGQVFNGMRM